MAFARRPALITSAVKDFCNSISPNEEPIFLDVIPDVNARIDECFYNVTKKISEDGGSLIHGWTIWLWPDVYIEAIFHGIWRSETGQLVDITPKANGEKRILFVPDKVRFYDFETNRRTDNIRRALADDLDIKELLECSRRQASLIERNSVGLKVRIDPLELLLIDVQLTKALERVALKYAKKSDTCFCGSTKKFGRCHGRNKS